jgi:hypothetical protein
MTEPVFNEETKVKVPAKSDTLWTLAIPYVAGPVKVLIRADSAAKWKCGSHECGPGGTLEGSVNMLLVTAPRGALIGKLGGSDSDCPAFAREADPPPTPATTPRVFSVGTYCIIDVKASESGPLFLTMNDGVADFKNHAGEIEVLTSTAIL